MTIKKTLITLPLFILSLLGVAVNGIYYVNSHNSSGYGSLLAFLMSICFLGLEFVLYLYKLKVLSNRWLIALKLLLIAFSILITMSAQFFSTSVSEVTSNKAVNNSEIILQQIEDNRVEKDQLNNRLNTYSEQDNTKLAREASEERIRFLSSENTRLYALLLSDETTIEQPKNVYSYYADKFNWLEPEDVRIIFQLISSFILAILAPVALTLMKHVRDIPKPEVKKKPKTKSPVKKVVFTPPPKKEIDPNILKMLLHYYPDGEIMEPEKALTHFNKFNENSIKKGEPTRFNYTLNEIRLVYNLIFDRNLDGSSKDEIKKGVME